MDRIHVWYLFPCSSLVVIPTLEMELMSGTCVVLICLLFTSGDLGARYRASILRHREIAAHVNCATDSNVTSCSAV
jgi:hypothetical protein